MEKLYLYFKENYDPILRENWQVLVILGGLLLLLGSIFRWKWICGDETVEHAGFLSFIYRNFGEHGYRVANGILGALLMICGIVMWAIW